ncbi:hypothetical protein BDF14DRAFT_1883695 [Spinellus fusiger]|nr:hypothetical protein BDF14DRAFT_1883695 [Spinellus fusiger]
MLFQSLPVTVLIEIVECLDTKDKFQMLTTCWALRIIFYQYFWHWSPLVLSHHSRNVQDTTIFSFFNNCSIPIVHLRKPTPDPACDERAHFLNRIDLSGCGSLTEDCLLTIASTLPCLVELHLNKTAQKRLGDRSYSGPFDQREYLYVVRPFKNISRSVMNLPWEPMLRLSVSVTTLQQLMALLPYLETLSLEHQPLITPVCAEIKTLRHLRYLNISSCAITQPNIQGLLETIGQQLLTLKMINIEPSRLTIQFIRMYGPNIKCLHMTCSRKALIPTLVNVLRHVKVSDFRLTRIGGCICLQELVFQLDKDIVQKLDLSPIMCINPKYTHSPEILPGQILEPIKEIGPLDDGYYPYNLKEDEASDSSIEYGNDLSERSRHLEGHPTLSYVTRRIQYLGFNNRCILYLASFTKLTELRLCISCISCGAFNTFLASSPQLEVLDIRDNIYGEDFMDYFQAFQTHPMSNLHTLYLDSMDVCQEAADAITTIKSLQHIAIYKDKDLYSLHPIFAREWLLKLPLLRSLQLGTSYLLRDTIKDIAVQKDRRLDIHPSIFQHPTAYSGAIIQGDVTFLKENDSWVWF